MGEFDRAMDKIRDEMAKQHERPEIAALGEYLTERLQADRSLSGRILAEGKNLAGAFEKMRDYARKNQKGGCFFMPPDTAMAMVCEYFGIPAEEKAQPRQETPDAALDLDALLEM